MKIFISHASANKGYGAALVDLLRGIGIGEKEIIFTSNVAYGIPNGQNIFDWLKSQISEKPYIIYLLSNEYYSSIACLNEMGAAWIIENEHTVIFTPDFDISCEEFQNGVLDPRKIGLRINDEDRLLLFIDQLKPHFNITKSAVSISQSVKKYLSGVELLEKADATKVSKVEKKLIKQPAKAPEFITEMPATIQAKNIQPLSVNKSLSNEHGTYSKLIYEITSDKLTDVEILLLHYIITTVNTKLGTGWREDGEITNIKLWEEIHELSNELSEGYSAVLRKFMARDYIEVSELTAGGNPREVKVKSEIEKKILYFPEDALNKINEVVEKNKRLHKASLDYLPF